ncbi:MAG: cytoskeleton protein RodZ [Cognaticolwellia sp.]|jgi:cytoskeleton protein RodZ
MNQEFEVLKNESDDLGETTDDIDVVVGPGAMLKAAREMRGFSQQQVANKLKFRIHLVENIEADEFDCSLPEAFNRGYLKSYAKLVNIAQEDVLKSYEKLAITQNHCAGMQSFSKGTEKQAEHNMLMWVTYLILAILVTATVVWWLQTPSEQAEPILVNTVETLAVENTVTKQANLANEYNAKKSNSMPNGELVVSVIKEIKAEVNVNSDAKNLEIVAPLDVEQVLSTPDLTDAQVDLNNNKAFGDSALFAAINHVVFTFAGDCWVNIFDATGERIAWGVKKSGYVMRISGQAPFSITLGKPELVQIDYNDVPVDMTVFNAGNIAKFSLPLAP